MTPRRAAWLVLRARDQERTEAEAQQLAHLRAQVFEVAAAIDLAEEFATLVRQRQPAQLDSGCTVQPPLRQALQRFATGLYRSYEAVKAGVTLPWSSESREGHINRLKMLKRQMFGRARLDLPDRRFLLAPRDRRARGPYPQEAIGRLHPGSGGVGVVPGQGGGRGMSQSRGSGVRRSSGRGATRAGQAGEVEACPRGRRSHGITSACLLGIEVWDILGLSRRHQKWARTHVSLKVTAVSQGACVSHKSIIMMA